MQLYLYCIVLYAFSGAVLGTYWTSAITTYKLNKLNWANAFWN
jgi:hypothetical protein